MCSTYIDDGAITLVTEDLGKQEEHIYNDLI